MGTPLVTIGISCFNCETYLPLLLNSIQAQTYANWEVVAIDDGSSDNTPRILQAIEDPRFRVTCGKKNRGLGYRLNEIADLAQGERLARTDADDVMLPQRIERQVRMFQEDPSLDAVCCGCIVVDNGNRVRGMRRIPKLAASAREVMLRNGPSHPTVMTRTIWAQRNRYLGGSRRGEDLDLWIRTLESTNIRYMPEALHVIREDGRFDAAKYERTILDHRHVMRRYLRGQETVWFRAMVESVLLARRWGYRLFDALGVCDRIAARRNVNMDAHSVAELEQFLHCIGGAAAR